MNAKRLIKRALRKINAYDRESEPTPQEYADCLEELNGMLGILMAKKLFIMHTVQESFSLSSGTASYTIGSGGNFNTTRPYRIQAAFIRVGTQDFQLEVVNDKTYRKIPTKSDSGRPYLVSYHPTYPLGYINFYYTPDSNYTVYFDNISPLAEITSLTANFTLAPEYENFIVYNLAILLASEFEKTPTQLVVDIALQTMEWLQSVNLAREVSPVGVVDMSGKNNYDGETC